MDGKSKSKIEKRNERQKKEMGFGSAAASHGFTIQPEYAIVISLIYVGIVIILHMIGKYRKDSTPAQ
jgi:hypothetical protein